MKFLDTKLARTLFGGDPRENHRRYVANEELKSLAEMSYPWTEAALKEAVQRWVEGEGKR